MKLVNTTKFDRKSGVAQWRDLPFAFMEKRNSEAIRQRALACPESETAGPFRIQLKTPGRPPGD
jgi:hypothetical protein